MTTKIEVLGADEVGAILDMAPVTVTQCARAGTIPAIGRIGRRGTWVFERSQIEEFKASKAATA